MCGVWVSSQPLLEAHFKGRRHLKRALEQADADATDMGLQTGSAPDTASVPRFVPLFFPFFGWVSCSLYLKHTCSERTTRAM